MRTITLVWALLFIGCGTPKAVYLEDTYAPVPDCPMRALAYVHDMTFTGYLKQFQSAARSFDVGCHKTRSMYFDEAMPTPITVAYCVPGYRIVVSKNKWDKLNEIERKTLVFHELGHCAFNMDHAPPTMVDIMSPELLEGELAADNWNYLIKEMFTRAQEMQR
jgi:hypothetical protein